MVQKNQEISVIHLFLYKKMKEKVSYGNVIATCDVLEVIRRNLYFMPKQLRYPIIREIENLGLLRRINKNGYKIIKSNSDKRLEKIINKIKELDKEANSLIALSKDNVWLEPQLGKYEFIGGKKDLQLAKHGQFFS